MRQDGLQSSVFFGTAIWVLGGVVAPLRAELGVAPAILGALAVTGVSTGFVLNGERQIPARMGSLREIALGVTGTANLVRLFSFDRTRRELARSAEVNLEGDRLPAEWLATIGRASVLVVPWEIAICLANEIHCIPYPTLQMYSTYSVVLDQWTADRLRVSSPEFVVASVESIDDRNMSGTAPGPGRRSSRAGRWCARTARRVSPRHGCAPARGRSAGARGPARSAPGSPPTRNAPLRRDWFPRDVPGRSNAVRRVGRFGDTPFNLALRLVLITAAIGSVPAPTPAGRVRERCSRLASGHARQHQVIRLGRQQAASAWSLDTAREGLLLDATPTDISDLTALFEDGAPLRRAEAIRVSGLGVGDFYPDR